MNSITPRISALWQRLSDRRKLPRRFWYPYPPTPPDVSDETLPQEQFNEVSAIIRRIMLVVIGYEAFCLIALGQPDAQILKTAAVQLPIINTSVSVPGFMLIGPLLLAGLTAYLHIFVGCWISMKHDKSVNSLRPPYLFNLPSRSAVLVSVFIFYWLPPIVLASFVYKAIPFAQVEFPILSVATLTTMVLVFLAIRRCPDNRRKRWNRLLWPLLLFLPTFLAFVSLSSIYTYGTLRYIVLDRNLDLSNADLSGANLRTAALAQADLSDAYLLGTDLRRAYLVQADLRDAVLRDAVLRDADLRGANLERADLRGSNLHGADLRGSNLHGADLREAVLYGAILNYADLREARGLSCDGLAKTRHWKLAYRDADLACDSSIPEPPALAGASIRAPGRFRQSKAY